jgi:hypothetical protein
MPLQIMKNKTFNIVPLENITLLYIFFLCNMCVYIYLCVSVYKYIHAYEEFSMMIVDDYMYLFTNIIGHGIFYPQLIYFPLFI